MNEYLIAKLLLKQNIRILSPFEKVYSVGLKGNPNELTKIYWETIMSSTKSSVEATIKYKIGN